MATVAHSDAKCVLFAIMACWYKAHVTLYRASVQSLEYEMSPLLPWPAVTRAKNALCVPAAVTTLEYVSGSVPAAAKIGRYPSTAVRTVVALRWCSAGGPSKGEASAQDDRECRARLAGR